MRLVWTQGGWKVSDFASIHVRGYWSLDFESTFTEDGKVLSEGSTRLWFRLPVF